MAAVFQIQQTLTPQERLKDAAWVAFVALVLGIPMIGLTTVDEGGKLVVQTRFATLGIFIAVAFFGRLVLRAGLDAMKARKLTKDRSEGVSRRLGRLGRAVGDGSGGDRAQRTGSFSCHRLIEVEDRRADRAPCG